VGRGKRGRERKERREENGAPSLQASAHPLPVGWLRPCMYTYICGDGESTMKALDRAVKHASAGDISDVKLCQASVNAVV
jgi:hypothetical protein